MSREERLRTVETWERAFYKELVQAQARTLVCVMKTYAAPTLGDLLQYLVVGMVEIEDSSGPVAWLRVGDLCGASGEGPLLGDLLIELGVEDVESVDVSIDVCGRELRGFLSL